VQQLLPHLWVGAVVGRALQRRSWDEVVKEGAADELLAEGAAQHL